MILDHQLLRVLLNREGWESFRSYIDSKDLELNVGRLVKVVDKLYEGGAESISDEELRLMLSTEYPNLKDDQVGLCNIIIDKTFKIDDQSVVFKEVIANYKNKQMSSKFAELSLKSMDSPDKFNIDEFKELVKLYEQDKVAEDDGSLQEFTWDDLLSAENPSEGYEWFSPDLTAMCGRMKGGNLILVIATPETGKSAFCHSASTHFAWQGAQVLHINNEERATKVATRARACWTKMPIDEMILNRTEAERRWSMISDRWKFRDKSSLTIPDIKNYIETDKPDIIFIDQAVKIAVKEGGRHDLTLTSIFKELREIVKDYGVDIIGVSQADAGAYSTDYLKMHHVANSNVGIQGELDTLIGLVRPQDSTFVNVSVPKGKESTVDKSTTQLELNRRISRMFPLEG